MNKFSLLTILWTLSSTLSAQKVENVRFEQAGKMINIYYDLAASQSGQLFDVTVYYSIDGGGSWKGPLNFVSGNTGKNQSAGTGKKISWDVLSECEKLTGNVVFEVRAVPEGAAAVSGVTGIGATGTFTDSRDGRTYKYVTIGKQVWMAENLAYLPSVSPPSEGSGIEPYYYVCGYQGSGVSAAKATDNYKTYGVLYNWPAAMAGNASSDRNPSGVKGVCPQGWHLPSDGEWTELTDYLGGEGVAGSKLKEVGTTHWSSPNTAATNETGFTALPGGYRLSYGAFGDVGLGGAWWSSTEGDPCNAWGRFMGYGGSGVYRGSTSKDNGFSVRCLRD